MIENANREDQKYPGVELKKAEVVSVRTEKVDFKTKTVYHVHIKTANPAALALGTLKASQKFNVSIEPANAPRKAEETREFK